MKNREPRLYVYGREIYTAQWHLYGQITVDDGDFPTSWMFILELVWPSGWEIRFRQTWEMPGRIHLASWSRWSTNLGSSPLQIVPHYLCGLLILGVAAAFVQGVATVHSMPTMIEKVGFSAPVNMWFLALPTCSGYLWLPYRCDFFLFSSTFYSLKR